MSFAPFETFSPQSLLTAEPEEIFAHEARRGPKPVVQMRGFETGDGTFVVETDVYPVGSDVDEGVRRHFPFPTRGLATRFVEDTLVALELLSCEIT